MAGPAPIATGINEDTRRLFEEGKKKLELAKQAKTAAPTPTTATQAPVSQLEGRKELADILKKAAKEQIAFNPQSIVKSGESFGVSRGQISDLYGKYRSEFKSNLPEGYTPQIANNLGESSTGLKFASQFETKDQPTEPQPQATTQQMAEKQPQDNKGKWSEGTFSGLEGYDKMQSEPMGSSMGQRRSLESESGKALRIARKLQRQGFGNAAEKMALDSGQLKMFEPSIKTEEFRKKESEISNTARQEAAKSEEDKKRQLELGRRILEIQEKQAAQGKIPEGYFKV
jgi:hypothetical protein